MVKYRRAEALFHYTIVVTIVALSLVAMSTYLRRGIQAKVKSLADSLISDKQLASLNDPETEKSTREISSNSNLSTNESFGGASSSSRSTVSIVNIEHEVENLEIVDYGEKVPYISNPDDTYMSYGSGDATIDSSNEDNDDSDDGNPIDNILSLSVDSSERGSGGGTMSSYDDGGE